MKKKWIAIGVLVCMLTACTACGMSGEQSSSQNTSSVRESSTITSSQDESSSSAEHSVVHSSSDKVSINDNESDVSADNDTSMESGDSASEEIPGVRYYTVYFDTDGGSEIAPARVEEGDRVTMPEDPKKSSKDGEYEFVGWYYGESVWDFDNDTVTQDMTLTAKWKVVESYTPPYLPKN